MGRFEKVYLLVYVVSLIVYFPCFILFAGKVAWGSLEFRLLVAAHFTLMLMGLIMFILVLRDLYKRTYMTANQKLTWGLWITLFSLSIIVYYIKHARHPRNVSPVDVLRNDGG